MILLDTHTWIWWAGDRGRLSRSAAALIEREAKTSDLLVSSISCWEVAKLVAKGRIAFDHDVEAWVVRALRLPSVRLLPLDAIVAVRSNRLPGSPPSDPVDQILLATAMVHAVPLVTKDDELRSYVHVRTVW